MFLEEDGFEIYLPKVRAGKREVPLFPSYLFVWIVDTGIRSRTQSA